MSVILDKRLSKRGRVETEMRFKDSNSGQPSLNLGRGSPSDDEAASLLMLKWFVEEKHEDGC